MCQVSLLGYGVGGAFLGLAYFDLPYHIMAIVVITGEMVRRGLERGEVDGAEDGSRKRESMAET